jgi:FtsP/CotA-like multicopper oxidase with cupredoxin domain
VAGAKSLSAVPQGAPLFRPNARRESMGAVEEWTIRNTHEHDDHMFHIHTNPFQVVEVAGQPQADRVLHARNWEGMPRSWT